MRKKWLKTPAANHTNRLAQGFTLLEVIVAIALLALLTAVSWRGLASMLSAQERASQQDGDLAIVQTILEQWTTDLDNVANIPALIPIDWDGKVFRITRLMGKPSENEGVSIQVVAWTVHQVNSQKQLLRWQSKPILNRAHWLSAWESARIWSKIQNTPLQNTFTNPDNRLPQAMALLSVSNWNLFYAMDDRWSNPLSNAQAQYPDNLMPPTSANKDQKADLLKPTDVYTMPDAIRLEIDLIDNSALTGPLTRDWLNPLLSNSR